MVANNFKYRLADGTTGYLHDIEANYTILMFNNPDCPMCRDIIDQIGASPLLNELQELERLKVIAVYPDSDLEAWHRYLDKMPRRWIVSYDEGCVIDSDDLYNISAIPALYLLDNKKRVLIKDGTSVMQIEEAIAYHESYK
jgi:thiol-disulfide isomerase/thioredoxin